MFSKITVVVLCVVFVHAAADAANSTAAAPSATVASPATPAPNNKTAAAGNGSQAAPGVQTNAPGKVPSSTLTTPKDQSVIQSQGNGNSNGQGTQNPPVTTTPKPMRCKDGSCDGTTGACINKLGNVTCTGVCTTSVTKVNETYSRFVVACATGQKTCAEYKKSTEAAKNPVPTCCETDLCNKYVANSAAPNTAVNIVVFAMVTGLLRKMLVVVANP